MGSWNETCMVTNLPILVGDPVVAQVIVASRFNESPAANTSYPHDRFTALGYPFRAEYDDYGGVRNIPDDIYTRDTLAYIRERLVERPQGENQYHDHEVRKDLLDWTSFDQWIRSGRLQLGSAARPVGMVMIHQAVYETMRDYRGEWERFDKADVEAEIKAILAVPKLGDGDNLAYLTEFGHREKLNRFIRDRELNNPRSLVGDDIDETAKRLAEMVWFDSGMRYARRQWMPTSGAGSQSEEWDIYHDIAAASYGISEKRRIELAEYEDDE